MAKMQVQGTKEYALKLSMFGKDIDKIAGKAIFGAADIVANEIKDNIRNLEAKHDKYNLVAFRKGEKGMLTIAQKKGLLESFGITKMAKSKKGFFDVKIGFDGYNSVKTKKYPKGQPNQLIARTLESGSSFMDPVPFVRPAVNATRRSAKEKMQQVIDEEAKKIME